MFTKIKNIEIFKNFELKNISSFQIGAKAKYFINCFSVKAIKQVIQVCKKTKLNYKIVGGCSNILFDDKGYNGAIIRFAKADVKFKKDKLVAYSGISMPSLINFSSTLKLSGLENFIGIPCNLGGAIKNNLGAFNVELGSLIHKVKILTFKKNNQALKLITKTINSNDFSYRRCNFLNESSVIISAELLLKKSTKTEIVENLNFYYKKKSTTQPLDFPSCGSIFKRDKNLIPAKIIDDLNLKGLRIGQAEISKKHAGFIINLGGAKSSDVLELIDIVKTTVKEKLNIELSCEIEYLGYD